ncbi:AB hydrolase superfamily protein [Fulvia fulva]|uniref:AB hydrolase superfamily protein n=1 Tax=Passalora fulva TaxID=5499 RepID=A0A9Q8PL83_PASFU|nr:AB hydrolase superfamily protein [Fulvia fulva]KAK4610628.1 AB hydrolase superfamily protein [Fulvia fulva]KAK4610875.1 AB hydrolase superfamily protein [Fulvia fulva]UJO24570.1 AB hydrolase superfamily protein [Fulvia fulva]WPV22206.1 AB hydrolase superfamily protein [Fulvia fulva]WPV36681.1 AB hydrolase superfamily protein [Fulvia fulva]
MAEFSEYGGASDELTQLLATLPAPPEQTLEELKRTVNEGRENAAREEMKALASQVHIKDHSIPTRDGYALEARSYRSISRAADKTLPIYIHYHGGGFLFGTLSSEDATCSRIAVDVEVVVLNVNYRHTPEHLFPTPMHDSEDAYDWAFSSAAEFHGDPSRIVIGGISAGGQLAASLAQTKHRENGPSYKSLKGQVLMIPCLVHPDCYEPVRKQMKSPEISSYKENEFAPILPVSRMKMFTKLLFSEIPALDDRRANPGGASPEDLKGLPPATFGIAGLDPLRDEAILYAKLLTEQGVPTDVHLFRGVPHGFRRFGDKLAASKHWDEVMHNGIRWALSQPKPVDAMSVRVHG